MPSAPLLPLFPLEVVLFPGTKLPLHIFEPRYRLMVGKAAEAKTEFGVVLAHEGKLADTGCTALVEQITQRFEDGRFNVETAGSRRFTLSALDESEPYLQGAVEYFEDDEDSAAKPADVEEVFGLAQQVANALRSPLSPIDPSHPMLSFHLAAALPLDLAFKQQLLRERSEAERLKELASQLTLMTERIAKNRTAQRLAGTNGQPR